MCKSMRVSENAHYYYFKKKDVVLFKIGTIYLKERIKALFEEYKDIYDSCRIKNKLEQEGLIYCRSCIGLLMK